MGLIIATILFYFGMTIVTSLFILGVFALGYMAGREEFKPKEGYVGFTSIIKRDIYNQIFDKGGYKNESDMLQDALTLLNWGMDNSAKGRFVASCEHDGTSMMEFPMETLASIRASANPAKHLERCLWLKLDEQNEDN